MKANKIRICGKNTSTLPAPAIAPSTTRLRNGPAGMCWLTALAVAAMPVLIRSMGRLAHEKTAWKVTNNSAARIIKPQTGCSTQASICNCMRCSAGASGAARARMRRTSVCSTAAVGGSTGGMVTSGEAGGRVHRASCASSAAWPSARTAMVSITGQPSSADSRATSITWPRWRAMSTMLSATSIGRPSRFSSSTSRRFMRRLVASTTATMASGTSSPARRPSITSSVTCSSGVAGCRL